MNFESFDKEIEKYFNEMKLVVLQEKKEKLYRFMELLIEKNKELNLTAITEEKEIIIKHFIDSIVINKYVEKTNKIIDIGTGAGFPGIPLKIMNEENEFILLDSLNKRINFITEVIEKMSLKKIEAVHMRAEEAGQNNKYREKFDIATSRAVSKLNVLAEYMLPLVKIDGKCICMKGPNVEEEIEEANKAIQVLGGKIEEVEKLILPKTDIARTIIIIRKIKKTDKRYPRKAGTPSNKPL